ncbi:unnamed protein product, partial [Ectocarpus sp. 8 AP-2014]
QPSTPEQEAVTATDSVAEGARGREWVSVTVYSIYSVWICGDFGRYVGCVIRSTRSPAARNVLDSSPGHPRGVSLGLLALGLPPPPTMTKYRYHRRLGLSVSY